jgi:tetratricopeptide (TPR) repeat protein
LADQEMWEEAVAEYRAAIRLKPDLTDAHYWLGHALQALGKYKEAIDAFRTAIRLKPDDAGAHCDLGSVLALRRDFSGSLAMYRKGHELGSRRPDWRQPSAAWVAEAERLAALEAQWPAVRNGRPPRDNGERLFFADLVYHRKHFTTAARLWAEAFSSDAKLMADRRASYAYNAARAAVLAAAGKGSDDPPPDDAAKAEFLARALDLLKAELDAWSRVLDQGPTKDRSLVSPTLELWRADPDLTSVRDADALVKLPEKDQESWRALWSDVDALLRKSKSNGPTR